MLGRVRVLVLVDQDVRVAAAPHALALRRAQDLERGALDELEVDRVRHAQVAVVLTHHLLVLPHRSELAALRFRTDLARRARQEVVGVDLVEDAELRGATDQLRQRADHAHAEAVERRHEWQR